MAESTPAPIEETPTTTADVPTSDTPTDPDIKAVIVNVPEEAVSVPAPVPPVKETPSVMDEGPSAKTQPMAETRTPPGAIVHFVMDDGNHRGACRPAIVVDVHQDDAGLERVNLQVLTDGQNDYAYLHHGLRHREDVRHDEDSKSTNSWHWIH